MSCHNCKTKTAFQCDECEDYCCDKHWYTYDGDRLCKNCIREEVSMEYLLIQFYAIIAAWGLVIYLVLFRNADAPMPGILLLVFLFAILPSLGSIQLYFGKKHPIMNQDRIWN